jgi:prophage regulatory protein
LLPHQAFENARCKDVVLAVLYKTFHPGGEHMAGTPSFRKLEYILAVARERHFGKAAERLHVDPSTLSQQIREVEQELGFDVFFRANHYVDITEEAKPFVPALEQMLARLVDEFEKAKNLARLRAPRKASMFVVGDPRQKYLEINEMTSFLRFPQVRTRVGLSRSTIYQKILQGEFPKPINLGARAVAWLESDVDAWMTAQMERHIVNKNPTPQTPRSMGSPDDLRIREKNSKAQRGPRSLTSSRT